MQFLEGGANGANGANGRESRTVRSSEQDQDDDQVAGHGSLMARYRGTPPPPTEDQATPRTGDRPSGSLPAPGTRPPAGASEDNPWRRSTWTPAPSTPPTPTPPASTTPATPPATPPPARPPAAPSSSAPAPPATTPERPADKPVTAAEKPAARPADTPPAAPAVKPADTPAPVASAAARSLLSPAESAEFRRRWRDLQADFVDDPQRAVRTAGDLSRQILQALADTIADAERVDRWKAQDGTSGTEDLRVALRRYRTLVDRLLEL